MSTYGQGIVDVRPDLQSPTTIQLHQTANPAGLHMSQGSCFFIIVVANQSMHIYEDLGKAYSATFYPFAARQTSKHRKELLLVSLPKFSLDTGSHVSKNYVLNPRLVGLYYIHKHTYIPLKSLFCICNFIHLIQS